MIDNLSYEIDPEEIKKDIDVILWSINLEKERRFFHIRFWTDETQASEFARKVEPDPRLESVADHSWHVCDIILLIGRHFPELKIDKCLKLAIIHDKMEIFTGDSNPIGKDGTGIKTYAFDCEMQIIKEMNEQQAIEKYLSMLPCSAQDEQRKLFSELLELSTYESKFVKAIDKLQALAYIYKKKEGIIKDKHLRFSITYAGKAKKYFPKIEGHYKELCCRILQQVAKKRSKSLQEIENLLQSKQMNLFDY